MRCDSNAIQCFSKKGLKTVTFAVQAPHVRGSSPYSAVVCEAFFKLFFVVHRGTCRGVTVPRAASVVRGHPPLCRVGKCPRRAAARTADRKFQLSTSGADCGMKNFKTFLAARRGHNQFRQICPRRTRRRGFFILKFTRDFFLIFP